MKKEMETFCKKPSKKGFQKLPLPIRQLFYQYSQEILQSKRKGNFRLAHRICAYHENKPLRMAVIVPDFWRKTIRKADGWEYDELSKDVALYRAGKKPIVLENQPTYFAIEVGNANQYLPTKKAGYLVVFQLKKQVRLFRLDSLSNINRLLRELYHSSPDLYEVVRKMFIPPLLKQYKKLYETTVQKTDPLQLSRLIRYSLIPNDFRFANWLCQNGFDGYSAGVMDIYVGMGRVAKEFPEEVLLCDPPSVLHTVGQIQTTKKTSRDALDSLLDDFLTNHA
jgi:hypothetical protein